jgi:hypothetical protein
MDESEFAISRAQHSKAHTRKKREKELKSLNSQQRSDKKKRRNTEKPTGIG